MTIYAIFLDNNQSWEDFIYTILRDHIYFDFKIAEKACFKLNNPVIIPPTMEEYEQWIGDENSWTFKEFVEDSLENQKNTSTYTIEILTIK